MWGVVQDEGEQVLYQLLVDHNMESLWIDSKPPHMFHSHVSCIQTFQHPLLQGIYGRVHVTCDMHVQLYNMEIVGDSTI